METEQAVCELQKPLTPGRKLLLGVTFVAAGAVCVFFFYAVCLVLLG